MPKRRRGPGYRHHSTKRLRGAATSIQKAWRRRKRSKFGLNTRTTLANRRAIKSLKHSREIKALSSVLATSANSYSGQAMRSQTVDAQGTDALGVVLVLKPFRGMVRGDTSSDRIGNDVKMRRLTMKFYVEAPTAALAPIVEEFNEICVLVCLDTAPNTTTTPQLGGGNSGSLLEGVSINPMLKYYETKNIGKTKRYRPLYKKIVRIAACQGGVAGFLQSTPYPPFARWSHTLKAPYKVEYGAAAALATLPQNQEIIVFFFSDSQFIPHPSVSCYCKFSYVDP